MAEEQTYYSVWFPDYGEWSGVIEIDGKTQIRSAPFALTHEEAEEALRTLKKRPTYSGTSHVVKAIPSGTPTTPHPSRKETPTYYSLWYEQIRWSETLTINGVRQDPISPFALSKEEAEQYKASMPYPNWYSVRPIPKDTPTTPKPAVSRPIMPATTLYSLFDSITNDWATLPYNGIEQLAGKPFSLSKDRAQNWHNTIPSHAKSRYSIKEIPNNQGTCSPPNDIQQHSPESTIPTISAYRLGDTVHLFTCNGQILRAKNAAEETTPATIIGLTESYAILGWKPGEKTPNVAARRNRSEGHYIANESQYVKSCTIPLSWPVSDSSITKESSSDLTDVKPGEDVGLYVDASDEIVPFRTGHHIIAKVLGITPSGVILGWKVDEKKPRSYLVGLQTQKGIWIEGVKAYTRYVQLSPDHLAILKPDSPLVIEEIKPQKQELKKDSIQEQPAFKHGTRVLYLGNKGRIVMGFPSNPHRWVILMDDHHTNFFTPSSKDAFPYGAQGQDCKHLANIAAEWGVEIDRLTQNVSGSFDSIDGTNHPMRRYNCTFIPDEIEDLPNKTESIPSPEETTDNKSKTGISIASIAAGAIAGAFVSALGKGIADTTSMRVDEGILDEVGKVVEEAGEALKESTV